MCSAILSWGHNFESLPLMTRLNCSLVSSVAIEAIHTYVPASPKVVAKIERVELLLSEELEGKYKYCSEPLIKDILLLYNNYLDKGHVNFSTNIIL